MAIGEGCEGPSPNRPRAALRFARPRVVVLRAVLPDPAPYRLIGLCVFSDKILPAKVNYINETTPAADEPETPKPTS